jgi:acyl-CoA thioester hydrolase
VNNVVQLRWAQDLATAHWMALAPTDMQARFVWVVTRHEIDYRAEIRLEDEVTGVTYVDATARGPLFGRTVELLLPGRTKPATVVRSSWCLVDAVSRRPMRVPPHVVAVFWPSSSREVG